MSIATHMIALNGSFSIHMPNGQTVFDQVNASIRVRASDDERTQVDLVLTFDAEEFDAAVIPFSLDEGTGLADMVFSNDTYHRPAMALFQPDGDYCVVEFEGQGWEFSPNQLVGVLPQEAQLLIQ